jgi:hypothetical protein
MTPIQATRRGLIAGASAAAFAAASPASAALIGNFGRGGGGAGPLAYDPAMTGDDLARQAIAATMNKPSPGGTAATSRVAPYSFQVEFVHRSKASATAKGYIGGDGQAQKIVVWTLAGALEDDALLQSFTDALYRRYLDRLKASGLDVVSLDEMKANADFMKLPGWDKTGPLELKAGEQHSKIFGATGLPMLAQQNDARAGFFGALPHSLGPLEGNIAAELGARLVEGRLAVDFVSLHSSDRKLLFGGRGARGSWASVDSTAAIALMPTACYVGATSHSEKKRGFWGGNAVARANRAVLLGSDSLEVVNTTTTGDKAAAAFSAGVGVLMAMNGGGAFTSSVKRYEARTTPQAYLAEVSPAAEAMVDGLVKSYAEAQPRG